MRKYEYAVFNILGDGPNRVVTVHNSLARAMDECGMWNGDRDNGYRVISFGESNRITMGFRGDDLLYPDWVRNFCVVMGC